MQTKIALFQKAHSIFYQGNLHQYRSDQAHYGVRDNWVSLHNHVKEGEIRRGDCEDAALTVVGLGLDLGLNPTEVGLARVATEGCQGLFNHAVAILLVGTKVIRVSDNRFHNRGVIKTNEVKYRWYDFISAQDLALNNPATLLTA